ncbi:hypothetical protein HPB47_013029, partial [Ixodes persulcatus]
MPTVWLVRNCSTAYRSASNVRFYNLPREQHRRAMWLRAIDRNGPDDIGDRVDHLCSDHFLPGDYETNIQVRHSLGLDTKHARLKSDAVSKQNLWFSAPPRKRRRSEDPSSLEAGKGHLVVPVGILFAIGVLLNKSRIALCPRGDNKGNIDENFDAIRGDHESNNYDATCHVTSKASGAEQEIRRYGHPPRLNAHISYLRDDHRNKNHDSYDATCQIYSNLPYGVCEILFFDDFYAPGSGTFVDRSPAVFQWFLGYARSQSGQREYGIGIQHGKELDVYNDLSTAVGKAALREFWSFKLRHYGLLNFSVHDDLVPNKTTATNYEQLLKEEALDYVNDRQAQFKGFSLTVSFSMAVVEFTVASPGAGSIPHEYGKLCSRVQEQNMEFACNARTINRPHRLWDRNLEHLIVGRESAMYDTPDTLKGK